jgi:hypothetical protein
MSRTALSISAIAIVAALGCSSRQDATSTDSGATAGLGVDAAAGIDASGDAGGPGAVSYGDAAFGASVDTGDASPANHRPTHASCPSQRGPGPSGQPYFASDAASSTACASDSQCTSGTNGRCFPSEPLVAAGGCSYDECFTDSDCGSGTPCVCRASATDDTANVCDPGGNCVVDSDCGPNGYCSPSTQSCYETPGPYFCHTPSDTCVNDSDCDAVDAGKDECDSFAFCAYDGDAGHWGCVATFCCPP